MMFKLCPLKLMFFLQLHHAHIVELRDSILSLKHFFVLMGTFHLLYTNLHQNYGTCLHQHQKLLFTSEHMYEPIIIRLPLHLLVLSVTWIYVGGIEECILLRRRDKYITI
uniref:Putative Calcineurin subunit B n=1 Tax=Davidia involucrata TaxID=16924 RepID=A0A5B6YKF5_DAVIN